MSAELLRKIESFKIDGESPPALPFAARLAREHGWSRGYTDRVIREYKRFVYLAVTAPHVVSPSEQVDATWHMHLTYTRSYWQRFCHETLGRPLHHEPTRGGTEESLKYRDLYERTLQTYRDTFGEEPPTDIWSPTDVRFGEDLRHVTVNRTHNWIIPKAVVHRAAGVISLLVFACVFATGCVGGFNPFALPGTDYFYFLIPALVGAFVASLCLRQVLRGEGYSSDDELPQLNAEQLAYLNSDHRGLASATIAKLVQSGVAAVSSDGRTIEVRGRLPEDATPTERAVYGLLPLENNSRELLKLLGQRVQQSWEPEREKLEEAGLTRNPGARASVALKYSLPYAFVFVVFGLGRLVLGVLGAKPVGYLFGVLMIALVSYLVLLAFAPRRTRKGEQLLAQAKAQHAVGKSTTEIATSHDAAIRVALFGTAALAGTQLDSLNRWYPKTSDGSSGGGCGAGCGASGGGGCGGGGCGGGGCGGCS